MFPLFNLYFPSPFIYIFSQFENSLSRKTEIYFGQQNEKRTPKGLVDSTVWWTLLLINGAVSLELDFTVLSAAQGHTRIT